ncbi:MAG TPA: NAD(P)H-dependent oxidoreductase [Candidatus Synoicihabitans sp.]|nr:NAD(P)H-dependent oxidoreductase [Candidatus Synoicihabitans sp.]
MRIVGIGGTTKAGSSTEKALVACLAAAEKLGARVEVIAGTQLAALPLYSPEETTRTAEQQRFVGSVRDADGLILATPAYHAGMSGLLKNAIDLLEDLRDEPRPYLDGRAVGCVVTAYGWQGAGTTLTSVRTIVHALRGWPTPLGVTLNTAIALFDEHGHCTDPRVQVQFEMLAAQVVEFARRFRA